MSEFDDLIGAADMDIMDTFGSAATLNDGVADYLVVADLEKNVEALKPHGYVAETHISIAAPPVKLKMEQTVAFTASGEVYTLREEIEDDGYMSVWAVTLNG